MTSNIRLSEHFTIQEFLRSETLNRYNANCHPRDIILNTPSAAELEWMRFLCRFVLDPLRKFLDEPIIITSGFRCPRLNNLVGGVPASQHTMGQAADLRINSDEMAAKTFYHLKYNVFVDQALYEKNSQGTRWIHVSTAAAPRQYFNDNYIVT